MTNMNLLQLLPPYYAEIKDYQAICQAEQPAFSGIGRDIKLTKRNFSPMTMDLETIQEWEKTLKILANPEIETLEFRRYRIINRLSTKPPFTVEFLRRKLDELIGPGLWSLDVDYPNYRITVESSAQPQAYSQEVEFTINRIKPAHIVYVHQAVLLTDLVMGEQVNGVEYGWNYQLGAWKLGEKAFASILKDEVVKVESTPSIQPMLLEKLLDFTSSSIVSARVNGKILVSALRKSVQDGKLVVTYPVSPEQTSEISQVELLDADGIPLTNAAVYIPVSDTVSVRHALSIKEV